MKNESLRKRGRVYPNGEHDNSGDNNNRYYPHAPISQISLHRLLAFGRFAHDPQRIAAAIHWLAFMGVELSMYLSFGVIFEGLIGVELRIAAFTDAKGNGGAFNDPQLSLLHDHSLAQMARMA